MMSQRFFYTVSAALMWAIAIVLTRLLLTSPSANVYSLLLWVSVFSLPYWFYQAYVKRKEIQKITPKQRGLVAVAGFSSMFLVNVIEFFALKYSPAVNFSFLIRMVIPFTVILAFLLLGEKITRKKIVLTILLLVGSYIFTTQGNMLALTRGDIFTLLEALLLAYGNNVLGKQITNSMDPTVAAVCVFFFGLAPLLIFSVVMGGLVIPSQIGLVILLTVSLVLLTLARYQAYKYGNASYVTMVFSFTPVFVSLMAIPLLGEQMNSFQITGGVLIVSAALLVEKLKI